MNLSLFTARIRSDYPVRLEDSIVPHPQLAAVLVTLFKKHGNWHVLLIKRSGNLRSHAGEIAFPGGVYEEEDESLLMTALREAEEETALQVAPEAVVGRLPTVQTLTEFQVVPFIALVDALPPLKRNPDEVEEILEIPLTPLLGLLQPDIGYRREQDMWVFLYGQHRIWGATARILRHLSNLI